MNVNDDALDKHKYYANSENLSELNNLNLGKWFAKKIQFPWYINYLTSVDYRKQFWCSKCSYSGEIITSICKSYPMKQNITAKHNLTSRTPSGVSVNALSV